MASDRINRRLPRRLVGASAVEFALIFPIVFAIVYGGICYGYIYFLQQRINFLAQEAVRAAIAVAPLDNEGDYFAAAKVQANLAVDRNFTLAGLARPEALEVRFPVDPVSDTFTVTVAYKLKATPLFLTVPTLFPTVNVPLVGSFPLLPDELVATAAGRLS